MSEIRVSGLVEESIVDGPGLRYVVFTQGCPHACPGCHNPETHTECGGSLRSVESLLSPLRENPLLAGLTLSGGEPFLQAEALCPLAQGAHALGLTVVTYTGYVYEDLLRLSALRPGVARLLELTDLLVDGPYVEARRDLELPFRGSANQRLLNRAARDSLRAAWSARWKKEARLPSGGLGRALIAQALGGAAAGGSTDAPQAFKM